MKIEISGEAEELEAFLYDCHKKFIPARPPLPATFFYNNIKTDTSSDKQVTEDTEETKSEDNTENKG